MSKTTQQQKKQKWIKKWEPHKHCTVCGLAIPPNKEFCSNKCTNEYFDWKKKKEKKEKRTSMFMILAIVAMVIIMVVLYGFSFLGAG